MTYVGFGTELWLFPFLIIYSNLSREFIQQPFQNEIPFSFLDVTTSCLVFVSQEMNSFFMQLEYIFGLCMAQICRAGRQVNLLLHTLSGVNYILQRRD
jgi:hypothetical protein